MSGITYLGLSHIPLYIGLIPIMEMDENNQ